MLRELFTRPLGVATLLVSAVGAPYFLYETDAGRGTRQGLSALVDGDSDPRASTLDPSNTNWVNNQSPSLAANRYGQIDGYNPANNTGRGAIESNGQQSWFGDLFGSWADTIGENKRNRNGSVFSQPGNRSVGAQGFPQAAGPQSQGSGSGFIQQFPNSPTPYNEFNWAGGPSLNNSTPVSPASANANKIAFQPPPPGGAFDHSATQSNLGVYSNAGGAAIRSVNQQSLVASGKYVASPPNSGLQFAGNSSGAVSSLRGQPISDLREIIRFDVAPAWVPQRFSTVRTLLVQNGLDALQAPVVTGNTEYDIDGTITYYFDAHQQVKRIQLHGLTGNAAPMATLVREHYGLEAQPSLGGHLYTTKWNNRVTGLLHIAPAPVLQVNGHSNRYAFILELNQPALNYGLSQQAQSILERGQSQQQWQ